MNRKPIEQQLQSELEHYFECSRNIKCPNSMKNDLYQKIGINKKPRFWSPRFAAAGLTLVFISSVVFKVSYDHQQQNKLHQAQADLAIAMYYVNQVSLKSLTAVNNNGIKPALIKPLARSVASL